jgi:hypothetical protein
MQDTMLPRAATLLDVQRGAWGPLREAVEYEREHGRSWSTTHAIQEMEARLVRVLSLPDTTPGVTRTVEGIRVVS